MPILDQGDEFTTAGGQAVTAAAIGTKVKNAGAAVDWGSGEAVVPYARVTGAADSDPTTSMTIAIIGADNAALDSNPVTLSTITVLKAALTKNSLHKMPPLLPGSNKQYLGVSFTPNGGNASAGKYVVGLLDKDGRPQDGVNYL